jgi:hypothetical protein
VSRENASREPSVVNEVINEKTEIEELHAILREVLPSARAQFRMIRISGLTNLFSGHSLDTSFLREDCDGLYPDSDDLRSQAGIFELCPNPWTTLFVTEAGDVHICFLAEPIGNVYETPLAEIWNSPRAVATRSRLIMGRYRAANCSERSCSWREGQTPEPLGGDQVRSLVADMKTLGEWAQRLSPQPSDAPAIDAVRRLLAGRERSSREMEALFQQLCATNAEVHERGQRYIDQLEERLVSDRRVMDELRSESARDHAHIADLELQLEARLKTPIVRAALRASGVLKQLLLKVVQGLM